jgi:hypothetical protein
MSMRLLSIFGALYSRPISQFSGSCNRRITHARDELLACDHLHVHVHMSYCGGPGMTVMEIASINPNHNESNVKLMTFEKRDFDILSKFPSSGNHSYF